MTQSTTPQAEKEAVIVSTASGKGGVGKSITTVNIAEELVRRGNEVAIIDADMGMPNCATLLNLQIPGSLINVLNSEAELNDLPVVSESGITMITAVEEPVRDQTLISHIYSLLDQILYSLQPLFDYILIDTGAGASKDHLWALDRSDMALLVLVDEPTVVSNMYKLCKMVLNIDAEYPFALVINRSADEETANLVQEKFNRITEYLLKKSLPYLGGIPHHPSIVESVHRQNPIVRSDPDHEVSGCYKNIVENLMNLIQDKSLKITH